MVKYIFRFIAVILVLIFFLRFYEDWNYRYKGNELIERVEKFKKLNGRLPLLINEISNGDEMGEGPYYKKESDSTYIVYFSIGFDNSLIYSSRNKTWVEKP